MSNNDIKELDSSFDELNWEIDNLFESCIPYEGKSDNLCGEIIRAFTQISYEYFNNGEYIGFRHGNKTCNAPARFLKENTNDKIASIISDMWGLNNEYDYYIHLDNLTEEVYDYVTKNFDTLKSTETCDMFDYTKDEDFEYMKKTKTNN